MNYTNLMKVFQNSYGIWMLCVCVWVINIFRWGEPAFSTLFPLADLLSRFNPNRERSVKISHHIFIPTALGSSHEQAQYFLGGEKSTTFHIKFRTRVILSVKFPHLYSSIHPVKCEPFAVNPLLPSF